MRKDIIGRYKPKKDYVYLIRIIFFALVYFIFAKIGLHFYSESPYSTLIWPPTGIALATLLIWGADLWPGILIGAFLTNLSVGGNILISLGIAIGNTLEGVIGTYLLYSYVKLYRCFERLRDTMGFILLATLLAPMVSATIGVATIWIGHIVQTNQLWSVWITWWIGDVLGALIITPFLLTCLRPTRPWNSDKLSKKEIFAGFLTLIALNIIIFWHPFAILQDIPLVYVICLPLLWSGLRFGSRGMTFSIFLTSIIAITSTVLGHGASTVGNSVSELFFMQVFIGSISITFLIFLSIVKERTASMGKLEDSIILLEEALQEIKRDDQAKTNFLAVLAHELRNPLSPILTSLELISLKNPGPEIFEPIQTIETHVKNMSRLLDDLLDMSRISKEKMQLKKEVVNLSEIIRQSVEIVEPRIKEKNQKYSENIAGGKILVYGDPLRLEQIIVNLLDNAVKYGKADGAITLTCSVNGNRAVLSVKDNGIGISEDMLLKIFEPFRQIKNEASQTNKGLGIGLFLTQKLVALHNGEITVKSKGLGYGSKFTIHLPIISESQNLPEKNKKENFVELPRSTKEAPKQNILVVDDNKAAADGLGKLLSAKGYENKIVYDGESALESMEDFLYSIVILDIGLPDMSGYEVARKIREKYGQNIKLLALTGYGQEEDKLKAGQAGFNHHLTKPVGIADIEKILNG